MASAAAGLASAGDCASGSEEPQALAPSSTATRANPLWLMDVFPDESTIYRNLQGVAAAGKDCAGTVIPMACPARNHGLAGSVVPERDPRPTRGPRFSRITLVALASLTLNTSVVRASPAARLRRAKTVKRRLTSSDHDRMIELYEAGDNSQSVAEQVGVAKSTVLRTLKARGVPVRPWGLHY